jgi:uncharacterized protein YecE (DUF72 family)
MLFTGTSGFAYKAWKGSFYPEKLPDRGMLAFYAEHLPAVEINNTFYRMPNPSVLEGWAEQVPESFRFVLKASRRITHMKRLKDVADEVAYLYQVAANLGPRLGPVLFQLPPNLPKNLDRLSAFLEILPETHQAVLEFRNPSWFDDDVLGQLRARGVALCIADSGDEHDAPFVATADFGYLRLRRSDYADADLDAWVKRVRNAAWQDTFVFFKHEDAGAGPVLAGRFTAIFDAREPRRVRPTRRASRSERAS